MKKESDRNRGRTRVNGQEFSPWRLDDCVKGCAPGDSSYHQDKWWQKKHNTLSTTPLSKKKTYLPIRV